jgi:hypothetical protein
LHLAGNSNNENWNGSAVWRRINKLPGTGYGALRRIPTLETCCKLLRDLNAFRRIA